MAVNRDALVSFIPSQDLKAVCSYIIKWSSGHDESVEVNQRALIDKVLARYSGEFTGVWPAFQSPFS